MKLRHFIFILTGIGAGFSLPLPDSGPGSKEATSFPVKKTPAAGPARPGPDTSQASAERGSESNAPRFPQASEIRGMDPASCLTAFDQLLTIPRQNPPPQEQILSLTALAMRLFREPSGPHTPVFPGARKLPAWLLVPVWQALAQEPAGIPESLRTNFATQPQGLEAARKIAEALARSSYESAKTFAQGMPPDWRKPILLASQQSLAAVKPDEAARLLPPEDGMLAQLTLTAARTAPINVALPFLLQSRAELSTYEVTTALTMLHERDPAALKNSIEQQNDAGLTQEWAKIQEKSGWDTLTGKSMPEILAAVNADSRLYGRALDNALARTAMQDPHAAIAAWSSLTDKQVQSRSSVLFLNSLGDYHPAMAVRWSEKQHPHFTAQIMHKWLASDAPAALQAILELPFTSNYRQSVIDAIKSGPGNPRKSDFPLGLPKDLDLAVRDLSPALQRQLEPEP